MTHGPTNFPTKGKCIYCQASNVKLSDEHIVPLSLGGQHVIEAASCADCAKITSKFERKVARDMWGDARISFDAPSRRKKGRPEFIHMTDPDNPNAKLQVPVKEYPAAFVFYKMGLPGLLQGLDENVDVSKSWTFSVIDDDHRRTEFAKKYPGKLTIQFRHCPQEFGQLICKIAYGHLLTQLDLGDFQDICLPYIMRRKTNVSYVIGGSAEDLQPLAGIGYSLNTSGFIHQNVMTIIVSVRLYANTHAPGYQVVVGKVNGDENIRRVLQKLGSMTITPK